MATVKELIEVLQNFPEDHLVLLSADSEGNKIVPLDIAVGEGNWERGEYVTNYDEFEEDEGYAFPGENALTLWPVF